VLERERVKEFEYHRAEFWKLLSTLPASTDQAHGKHHPAASDKDDLPLSRTRDSVLQREIAGMRLEIIPLRIILANRRPRTGRGTKTVGMRKKTSRRRYRSSCRRTRTPSKR